jgi:hypothetical protein
MSSVFTKSNAVCAHAKRCQKGRTPRWSPKGFQEQENDRARASQAADRGPKERQGHTWATDLAPYQSPTFRAISISHQTEKDKADRGTTVLHSLDQVKQLLLSRGVSPEQFGRALMEPMPPMIEHEDHGEKKR